MELRDGGVTSIFCHFYPIVIIKVFLICIISARRLLVLRLTSHSVVHRRFMRCTVLCFEMAFPRYSVLHNSVLLILVPNTCCKTFQILVLFQNIIEFSWLILILFWFFLVEGRILLRSLWMSLFGCSFLAALWWGRYLLKASTICFLQSIKVIWKEECGEHGFPFYRKEQEQTLSGRGKGNKMLFVLLQ